MANERALGLSFIYATQTWRQLVMVFGEHTARSLLTLTNTVIVFGGSKDAAWNKEISDLLGTEPTTRTSTTRSWRTPGQTTTTSEDVPVIRPEEIRRIPDRHALVIPENQPRHRSAHPLPGRRPRPRPTRRTRHHHNPTRRHARTGGRPVRTTTSDAPIVYPFPTPPATVRAAFDTIAHVRVLLADITAGGRTADLAAARLAALGDPTALPRPWDPATCPPDLQDDLWDWIDQVVTWHNADHAWRPERLIPT